MKKLRTWLLPVFTILIVISVTFLPQHLSNLQDQKLMGQVHTEKLTTENSLPTHSANLIQRMELLVYWKEAYDVMSALNDVNEDALYDEICATVLAELQSFADSSVLPPDLIPKEFNDTTVIKRIYLQRQLVRAEYYMLETHNKTDNSHLSVVLDRESRQVLWLELEHPSMEKYYKALSPSMIGFFLLHGRLGLKASLMTDEQFVAVFQLPGAKIQYFTNVDKVCLHLYPILFYPETDASVPDLSVNTE